jgi:hypothetical protein
VCVKIFCIYMPYCVHFVVQCSLHHCKYIVYIRVIQGTHQAPAVRVIIDHGAHLAAVRPVFF